MTSEADRAVPGAVARPQGPAAGSPRQLLARALQEASYEVLPLRSTEEAVVTHVPCEVPLTVTTTEAKGLERTLDLAERLSGRGYTVAPHLAARLVRDESHLAEVAARLTGAGVTGAFVIAGDAPEPTGTFPDALSLLEALDRMGRPFRSVGIAGYPEGHGRIDDRLVEEALRRKAPHATHVLTQLCFNARTTVGWARGVQEQGVPLPVRVGVPGVVSRQKLVRISAGLGLGQSARFLAKQQNLLWRFFLPGGYRPDRLVDRLAPALGLPGGPLRGLHVFTFNEVEKTEAWRRDRIARLSGEAG
jgi:methylenetetrahydrofolate reductase (NADPH)